MGLGLEMAMTGNVLERIVVLLLALADLAERAAAAPDARRRLVLAILRHGETVASEAFGSAAACAASDSDEAGPGTIADSGDGPEDAMALAASLRALALIVRAMTAPQRLSLLLAGAARDRISHRGSDHRQFARCFATAAFPPAPRLDTS